MTSCPHSALVNDRAAKCSLANARVSIPRVCGPCQAAWIDGEPPTAETLTPILVQLSNIAHVGPRLTAPVIVRPTHTPPDMVAQLKSATAAFIRFIASGGVRSTKAERAARMDICKICPEHQAGRCQACGCFVSVKSWMPEEHCPLGKWPGDTKPSSKRCGHCGK